MKIAVCFFGLVRDLESCLKSIEDNVLNPTRKVGQVTVYLHTYHLEFLTNFRSSEFNVKLNTESWKLLKPDKNKIEVQGEIDKTLDFKKFLKWPNPWPDDLSKNSMRNVLRQLHSVNQVYTMVDDADVYIFLRPDCRYYNPIHVFPLKSNQIIVPSWGWYDGVNDRFAIAGRKAAKVYASRLDKLFSLETGTLHAETLLHQTLMENDIEVISADIFSSRIRADGRLEPEHDPMYDERKELLGKKKVAICLYGSLSKLQSTSKSIHQCLVKPLKKYRPKVYLCGYTNKGSSIPSFVFETKIVEGEKEKRDICREKVIKMAKSADVYIVCSTSCHFFTVIDEAMLDTLNVNVCSLYGGEFAIQSRDSSQKLEDDIRFVQILKKGRISERDSSLLEKWKISEKLRLFFDNRSS